MSRKPEISKGLDLILKREQSIINIEYIGEIFKEITRDINEKRRITKTSAIFIAPGGNFKPMYEKEDITGSWKCDYSDTPEEYKQIKIHFKEMSALYNSQVPPPLGIIYPEGCLRVVPKGKFWDLDISCINEVSLDNYLSTSEELTAKEWEIVLSSAQQKTGIIQLATLSCDLSQYKLNRNHLVQIAAYFFKDPANKILFKKTYNDKLKVYSMDDQGDNLFRI